MASASSLVRGRSALYKAVEDASEPWFRRLGAFYQVFEDYLPDDPLIRGWRTIWERRRDAGNDWPRFLMKPEVTFAPGLICST